MKSVFKRQTTYSEPDHMVFKEFGKIKTARSSYLTAYFYFKENRQVCSVILLIFYQKLIETKRQLHYHYKKKYLPKKFKDYHSFETKKWIVSKKEFWYKTSETNYRKLLF